MAEKKTKELTKEQIEAKQKELAKKIRKAPITEIAHKLKDCSADGGRRCDEARFALFLGAGASFQAGIKTAGQMMAEFREKILKRDCPEIIVKEKQEEWISENVLNKGNGNEYSKLFEAFERTQKGRQTYISKLIKDKKPTFGYAMLASIVARGFLNTILTTNFDDLMFIACNKFTGVRPVIYAYGIMATEMKFSSPHSKILKMHGDYLYSALANTEKEMSLFNQDPNMKAQVTHALNEYELIIFGYSGNDSSIMEILENYPSEKEIYWCHWSQELPSLRALEMLHAKDGTLVAIEGFDDAMYEIYKIVDFELNEVLASYEDRRNEILSFIDEFDRKYSTQVISEAIEETKKSRHTIQREPSTWFEYFEQANYARRNNNFETAEKYYRKAIELNPKFADAYRTLGVFLDTKLNKPKDAETYYRKAIEVNSKFGYAYTSLGSFLAKDKSRWQEAEEVYRKAIKLIPTDAYCYISLGKFLARDESRWQEAEEVYHKAIELISTDAYCYISLGNLLAKDESRWQEAEEVYRKAIKLSPKYADAYISLGNLLARDESRWQEAEEVYHKAIELSPPFGVSYILLGNLLAKDENRWQEAEEVYRKAIKLSPKYADAYISLGKFLAKDENRWQEAEEVYRKAIEVSPTFGSAYISLGNLLAKDESQWQEEEEVYRKAIEVNPTFGSAYISLGDLLTKDENRWQEAENYYRKAIEVNPFGASAYVILGDLLSEDENRFEEAEDIYRKAIEVGPNYSNVYYSLGNLLIKQNRFDEAIEAFQILAKLDENDVASFINLASIYKKQGNKKESKKCANQAKAIIKDDDYFNLACLSSILNKKGEAFKYLKLAVEESSHYKAIAKNDPDFEWIRDDKKFWEIVGRDE
jgi:tetratricopeptide (TPR) repeat protein